VNSTPGNDNPPVAGGTVNRPRFLPAESKYSIDEAVVLSTPVAGEE
jgi:hypothetical protein